jgi:hypothetical protein
MATKKNGARVLTAPDYKVTVAGKEYVLVPCLDAVTAICSQTDGLIPAYRSVKNCNITVMAGVILAGSGTQMPDAKAMEAFVNAVWCESDKVALGGVLSNYLALLLAGGAPPSGDDASGETDPR